MRKTNLFMLAALSSLVCLIGNQGFAGVTVDPVGISATLAQGEEASQIVTITNSTDAVTPFEVKFRKVDREEERHLLPSRDDAGDLQVLVFTDGAGWGGTHAAMEGAIMAGVPEDQVTEVASNRAANIDLDEYNVIVWVCAHGDEYYANYSNNRERFEEWVEAGGILIGNKSNGSIGNPVWTLPGEVPYADGNGEGRNNRERDCDLENPIIAGDPEDEEDDLRDFLDGNSNNYGHFDRSDFLDNENIENQQIFYYSSASEELLTIITWDYGRGHVLGQSLTTSAHWYWFNQGWDANYERWFARNQILWAASVGGVDWLEALPEEGEIEVGEQADIDFIMSSEGLENGFYEIWVDVEFPGNEVYNQRFSAFLTVGDASAGVTGTVTEARGNHDVIPDVTIALDHFVYERSTDDQGAYQLENLPAGVYAVTFSAPNFLPETHEVELGEDDVELNVELLQAECNLSTDLIDEAIAPDTDTHINFSVSNDGNGPLTYTVERRLIGDANAAPWEMRREYPVANLLEDNRIEGVAFDGDNFYFAGANDNDPNTIYVTDRDGNLTDSFVQPGESRYGMKDLEWDGELLWGSGEARIFGFETDGTIRHEFQGPVNPSTSLIAYDPDRDQLWVCGTTSAIFPITKEGEAAGNSLNSKRLRMYGISYWPDDPDGYNLYLLTAPNDTSMYVYKMDPESGDTIRVKDLHPQIGEAPGGVFICNTFDVYSWVMMFTNNIAPANGGDRNFIYQLDARKEWFMVEPVAGVIDAGADQAFDLHLNAAGLPAVTFEGELLFTHDGDGSASILSVRLDVVEGPVQSEREISLTTGWNLVSANLQPDEESIIALTQGLADDDNLLMVKDDEGRFYLPSTGFSNLEGWNVAEGYWMKVRRPAEFLVSGMTVMAEDVIGLHEGWQAVSYYPRREVEATAALSGIEPVLRIAKDGMGNFYLPGHNYSNIGMLRQGQGYQLAVTEAADLVYRLRLDEQVAGLNQARGISVYDRPGRFGVVPPTGRNMSLLVTGKVVDGTDVGVYAGETFIGSGVFALGRAGVAVWGDDPSTQAIEGAGDGAELTLRIRDDLGERSVKALLAVGELVYSTDGLAVVTVSEVVTPREFGLTGAYPNPFNGRLTAGFDLPEAGLVTVGLYDLSGREVLRVVEGRFEAGSHSVAVNGESLPSGVYVLRVEAFGRVSQLKAALIK